VEDGLVLSRAELQRFANRERVGLGALEKDYVLTQVLNNLSAVDELATLFVFKGGTALRKIYFPGWRYSEDLDFTVKRDMPEKELHRCLNNLYAQVFRAVRIRLSTLMLHKPDGYARLRIQFIGPLAYKGTIFMDLSFDEPVCLEPVYRRIISHPFAIEELPILVYPLEELLAEKIRSLVERGKSRDYYDVWRIIKEYLSDIDTGLLVDVLSKKLHHKQIILNSVNDFFPDDIHNVQRYWDEDLSRQVSNLPALDQVLKELASQLSDLIKPEFFRK
jgi:predicted nucleotidyltransferase component of viral defense system